MTRNGWILLLVHLSIPACAILAVWVLDALDERFGVWARTPGGLVILAAFAVYLRYLWRLFDRMQRRARERARSEYTGIYRVVGALADTSGLGWREGLQVRTGDYGWEAQPPGRNGLLYLEGLTEDWGVLWYAGFEPWQVEYVCPKPVSQYDWEDFEYAGPKARARYHWGHCKPLSPCPYPVPRRAPKGVSLMFPGVGIEKW